MALRTPTPVPLIAEQEALLNSIRLHPDEDTPRLAYADMLDEIGGGSNKARAEFIRLQVRLDAGGGDLPNRKDLQAKVGKLLRRHRREWEGAVRVEGVKDVKFCRGFVDSLTTTADVFVQAGGEWWDEHPIRHVRLEEVCGSVDRVAAVPHIDNVRSLWLADEFGERELRPLAESPRPGGAGYFPALETLYVGGWTDDDDFEWDGASALAECHMPRLRELHLLDFLEGDAGAAALAGAPWFAGIETLDIYTSLIGDAGLVTLLTSSPRKKLSDLTVGYSRVTAQGLHALAELRSAPPLRWLCLAGSRQWVNDPDYPLSPDWAVDTDRVGAVLRKYPTLRISLKGCPIPPHTQTELKKRFGDRVRVGP